MQYDDTNSGVLFRNDKEGNDKRPDHKGKLNVEGKEYEIAAWERIPSKGGNPFLSIKISEPRKPEGNGYQKFKQQGEKLKETKPVDQVYDLPEEQEISLEDIPF